MSCQNYNSKSLLHTIRYVREAQKVGLQLLLYPVERDHESVSLGYSEMQEKSETGKTG